MPTPDRTSLEEIVRAGVELVEARGLAGLTMQAVASRVGVRAPSLYKRVRGRDDLIRLITDEAVRDLEGRLLAAEPAADAGTALRDLARAFRAFAHDRPAGYRLIFAPESEAGRGDPELLAQASAPLLRVAGALAGSDDALAAARTITAWAHGFVSMELAGAFRLGGDVDQAFEYGLTQLTEALTSRRAGPTA
jgi:AcrR family transcriptional regulator